MWYAVVIIFLTAYLLGNLNGSVCISALVAHDDVRKHGSGNAGMTNFLRSYGGKSTFLVILVDVGKTALACLAGGLMLEPEGLGIEGMMLGAIGVSLGHDFPMLLGFRGGKGILCGATMAFVLDWRIGLIAAAAFFLLYLTTNYVSLSSIASAAAVGILFPLFWHDHLFVAVGGTLLAVLAIFMHRENIRRLLKGTESKVTLGKKEKGA